MPYRPGDVHERDVRALVPARTLLLGDSFTLGSRPMLGPFFAKITLLHNEVRRPGPQVAADPMAAPT